MYPAAASCSAQSSGSPLDCPAHHPDRGHAASGWRLLCEGTKITKSSQVPPSRVSGGPSLLGTPCAMPPPRQAQQVRTTTLDLGSPLPSCSQHSLCSVLLPPQPSPLLFSLPGPLCPLRRWLGHKVRRCYGKSRSEPGSQRGLTRGGGRGRFRADSPGGLRLCEGHNQDDAAVSDKRQEARPPAVRGLPAVVLVLANLPVYDQTARPCS